MTDFMSSESSRDRELESLASQLQHFFLANDFQFPNQFVLSSTEIMKCKANTMSMFFFINSIYIFNYLEEPATFSI